MSVWGQPTPDPCRSMRIGIEGPAAMEAGSTEVMRRGGRKMGREKERESAEGERPKGAESGESEQE
eukprot:167833-Rhodomonas_salina.2